MTEHHIPTEQELDALLECAPAFDPETIKRNVLAYAVGEPVRPRRRKLPVRGLFIAAVVCVLSASVITAADYAPGGRISRSLGIQKLPQQIVEAEPETVPDEETEETPSVVQPQPKPVERPAEPPVLPELDEQIAEALQVTPSQKETLRPAVQDVGQSAKFADISMTVLQTLGDPDCLYIKLRFDFPTAVSVEDEAEFDKIHFSLDRSMTYSWSYTVLERDTHYVVYLIEVRNAEDEDLNGQTATIQFENYGQHAYVQERNVQFKLKEGETRTVIVSPDGKTMNGDASAEDVAALESAPDSVRETEDGFRFTYMTDGTQIVTYDGKHGAQYVTILLQGESPVILTGDNPWFKPALEGSWSHSWQLSYEDTSLYWKGAETVLDPAMVMTEFRISPLSWSAMFTYQEYVPWAAHEQWEVQLLYTDGTRKDMQMKNRSYFGDDTVFPNVLTQSQVFETPLDLTGVKAVIIDGKEFPLS